MSAYKDSSKNTWYVKFRCKDWTNHVKWITKRGFNTKRNALQWETDYLAQQAGNLDMSFEDFIQIYKKDKQPRLKESTWATKENIVDTKILPYFKEKRLCDVSPSDIVQWQNNLLKYRNPENKKSYSPVYLKTVHNQLSAIFNHAVRFYKLASNPARTAGNMGSEKGTEMHFWTTAEYLRFAEEMMDKSLIYYSFEMLYWCGSTRR